jgi:hypothetical protein
MHQKRIAQFTVLTLRLFVFPFLRYPMMVAVSNRTTLRAAVSSEDVDVYRVVFLDHPT